MEPRVLTRDLPLRSTDGTTKRGHRIPESTPEDNVSSHKHPFEDNPVFYGNERDKVV